MREFQTEVTNAGRTPIVKPGAGLLSLGAEDGIAAADVGNQRMSAAIHVTERNSVLFAWAAAILIRCSGRKKTAKDAVLGMENGQMLISDDFHKCAADLVRERADLGCVEIVRGSDAK